MPAAEFPLVDEINAQQTLTVDQGEFRRLIDKTIHGTDNVRLHVSPLDSGPRSLSSQLSE